MQSIVYPPTNPMPNNYPSISAPNPLIASNVPNAPNAPNAPISDWSNSLYNSASGVGEFKADLVLFIGLIFSILLFVVGIYMILYDDDDKYLRIKGVVVQPNCTTSSSTIDNQGKTIINYKCNMSINYTINNKSYSKTIFTSGATSYVKDEPIDLMVLKSDYTNVQIAQMSGHTIGNIFILLAMLLSGASYLNYYLTHNYKIFAAAQGISTITGLFR